MSVACGLRHKTFRLHYLFIGASQWDGNPAFTAHAVRRTARAFRAAIKLYNVVTSDVQRGHERGDGPGHPRQWSSDIKNAFIKIL